MPEKGRWRISTAYDYVDDLDPPDLAWEFLRRNPEYRKDFARLTAEDHHEDAVSTAFAEKWGLSFRGGPRHPCTRGGGGLDAGRRPVDVDRPGAAAAAYGGGCHRPCD
ncbi:transcriptional regulator domain-containing protein [Rhizobium rhizogenes]|uniref:transcriptional regulator domain-containing protein n=1 Tax=Rhizobium rhizogenes TaxID=359 RepID=UPI001F1E041C|nr:DUF6499 domain-containing protein [Rhizobium rhizogenes]